MAVSTARWSSTAASDGVSAPLPPPELQFHDTFIISEASAYHVLMLKEANAKHGVSLNVAPQLPPAGSPPEVPQVIFSTTLQEYLAGITLACPASHTPPPLNTCGTRGLLDASVIATPAAPPPQSKPKPTPAPVSAAPKDPYSSVLSLPTDDDVEQLLLNVWDVVGQARTDAKAFVVFASMKRVSADNRKPLTEDDLKQMVRATPEGVAPGIRSTPTANPQGGSTPVVSIKVLSARFPNPFGDSSASDLDSGDNEPLNPFLGHIPENMPREELFSLPGAPSLAAAVRRRFSCPKCNRAFRLLDALIDHYADDHDGATLSERELQQLRQIEAQRAYYNPKKLEGPATVGDGFSRADGTERPAVVAEEQVTVHARALNNTVLVGEVVDVQKGFLKSLVVTQCVVKTCGGNDEQSSELVVVRCLGDGAAAQALEVAKLGRTVAVLGTLRLNRHPDADSKRSHAYPFIEVCPPLGSLTVVE